ncbi:STAS domain-containing protein [Aestuariispira insulae]|nr:STAS domain-containing protein [Aestuariispira insulae]
MYYDADDENGAKAVKLYGELTFNDHGSFNDLIEELSTGGTSNISCDLSGLEFIDSSGLGLLLLLTDRAKKNGWTLTFLKPQGQVAKMLKYTEISKQLALEE